MAEQWRRLSDAQLEGALVDLRARLDFPPTPDLAGAVRRRLLAQPARPRPRWTTPWPAPGRLALVLVVLLLLAGGVLALSPEARTAVAERLGLRGVSIEYLPFVPAPTPTSGPTATPTPGPTPPPSPTPVPAGARLSLGERVTLAEAERRAPYRVLRPESPVLGAPDEVYFGEPMPGGQVALVYRPRPGLPPATGSEVGLLMTQFRGSIERQAIGKGLGPGSRLEQVTVNGAAGFWIEGQPHLFLYRDRAGRVRDETIRLAANVLLWEQGDLTVRLESALPRDDVLRIAASIS